MNCSSYGDVLCIYFVIFLDLIYPQNLLYLSNVPDFILLIRAQIGTALDKLLKEINFLTSMCNVNLKRSEPYSSLHEFVGIVNNTLLQKLQSLSTMPELTI